ncbi:MAG: T9SS type A sorting domain-containing protein [Bacteroidia bacterium]|nr:T9SS type A sorting domain-containing protein [Bacteroidia bacterium]
MGIRLIIFILCITGSINSILAQTNIPAGNISGIWAIAVSPYLVQGSITIPNDSTLTIMPGVVVEFQGHYKLNVQGRLVAIGTVTDSITFTVRPDSIASGWHGIRFDGTSTTNDSSKLVYCNLQYGKATGSVNDKNGGAVFLNNFSKLLVANCYITNNRASSNGGGICYFTSNPIITNNTICNNSAKFGGGIDCSYSDPTITNNTISTNSTNSNSSYGGGISCYSSSPAICNNTISNNITEVYGGGIFCFSSSPAICNNTISNNSISGYGGGISCFSSSPTIINNTISNNRASFGGGVSCRYTSNPTHINTIMWGNTALFNGQQICLVDDNSDPTFTYCDVQGDSAGLDICGGCSYTGVYMYNIDSDPLFVAPSAGAGNTYNGLTADWSLQETSPCIDAGIPDTTGLDISSFDIDGNIRVSGCRIDIGAFEFQSWPPLSTYITNLENINCNGDPTASVMVSVTGGILPYTFQCSDTATQSDSIATGLSADTYTVVVTDSNGCVAIDSVTITEPPLIQDSATVTICDYDSVFLQDAYQNTPGIYYNTLTAANGCDSILITTLSVNPTFSINDTSVSICAGDSVLIYGTYRTIAGIYYDSLTSLNGCDSVHSTILTVNPTYSINTADETICDGDSILIFGTYRNTAGTYYDSVTTAYGCDSVILTELIVNLLPTVSFTGLDTGYCSTDAAVTLTGIPEDGIFTGTGMTGNQFNPAVAGVGTHIIIYSFTDNNSCTNSESQNVNVNNCTGINNFKFVSDLEIYPNPNTGKFNIEMNITQTANLELQITNNLGQTIYSEKLYQIKGRLVKQVDLKKYPTSIYNLKLVSDKGIKTRLVIIK